MRDHRGGSTTGRDFKISRIAASAADAEARARAEAWIREVEAAIERLSEGL